MENIIQFGEHITIDGYNGDRKLLGDRESVLSVLNDLPLKLGMRVLQPPSIISAPDNGQKDPGGWTGFVIIAESHISIHTFPKRGFVSADIYTCKSGMDTKFIIDYFTNTFRLTDVETNFIKRGTRYPFKNFKDESMIPIFPDFKKLEWSDRQEFEKYSLWLAPHSDFNFVSIWAWDTNETMKLSKLNDNLVIFFNDYVTGEHYLSFTGKNKLTETALQLINFSKENYGVSILKYVPEEIANEIIDSELIAKVDESNCDHVCFVADFIESDKLTRASGNTGNFCRTFLKLFPQFKVEVCPINEVNVNELKGLFEKWAGNKKCNANDLVEFKAFNRYFQLKEDNIKILLIYIDDVLIGFQTIEILSNEYATCEFSKGDIKYRGIFQFMQWKLCEYLHKEGIKFLNLQVDMGHFELRDSKNNNYQSKVRLKRFIVESQTTFIL